MFKYFLFFILLILLISIISATNEINEVDKSKGGNGQTVNEKTGDNIENAIIGSITGILGGLIFSN
ncbi:expressed protein [Dictyostelium purpureum]|uniref:Expressed protein n=1 Tax=Dictyostelium purpureum TaxID=5786 RepID=F0ZBE9_DICPU|nr:uncharacterized protein DICPUDRAFT_71712 [Dictyostelium purpureum]EGC38735.1 expressed protein [Dictyostelium purpureum]|eukprot:XP_003284726.1 expressed protein [Dictyostelium purpureum]